MLKHTRKGTTNGYKRNPTTDEQFISKAMLCSILLLSRKHLQLFATGSFHFEPANFYSIHFLKVRHFPGKIDNKPLPGVFLEAALPLQQTFKKVLRPIFIWRGTCREFFARLAASRRKKLGPVVFLSYIQDSQCNMSHLPTQKQKYSFWAISGLKLRKPNQCQLTAVKMGNVQTIITILTTAQLEPSFLPKYQVGRPGWQVPVKRNPLGKEKKRSFLTLK